MINCVLSEVGCSHRALTVVATAEAVTAEVVAAEAVTAEVVAAEAGVAEAGVAVAGVAVAAAVAVAVATQDSVILVTPNPSVTPVNLPMDETSTSRPALKA